MKATFTFTIAFFVTVLFVQQSFAQSSLLINFGSNRCDNDTTSFSLIKDPLSPSPQAVSICDLSQQQANYFSVFIAYNPLNNRIYVADIKTGINTNIWVLDMGLPAAITCPATIPVAPTYSYSYISNNFEFDNNGDLWSFSNYNSGTGQCNIDKFDVNTGAVLSTKVIQFPAGNFPTTISSGDLTILPNGRMFAVLGNGICRLYEITDYNTTGGIATATYLTTMPKDCYGIAYLNGLLELTGMDFGTNCYYYDYNIAANTLGIEKPFQNGQAPIDNTSLTPSLACTKQLVSATKINDNTADLVYEIYFENLGNVVLNNVNLTDDLNSAFGAGNVSNVSTAFVPGSNAANLQLNPAFNGTTNTTVLLPGQNLKNKVLNNNDYYFKVQIGCRATNLNGTTTYFNSAIANANIGAANPVNMVAVSDSSNNGDSTIADPNKNGNASDVGENRPTPFNFSVLPVKFLHASATLLNTNTALVKWQVATPMENAALFIVEFSTDGRNWKKAGEINIDNSSKGNWQLTHTGIPTGNLYYRIKQIDKDGSFTYTRIVLLKNKLNGSGYVIYPNPANNFIAISSGYDALNKATVQLFDATGRLLLNKNITSSNEEISTATYQAGTYMLRVVNEEEVMTYKVIIRH
ncbi:MAG: T9SS type A sorting domain-containing protein [Bacteroidota bacterium]